MAATILFQVKFNTEFIFPVNLVFIVISTDPCNCGLENSVGLGRAFAVIHRLIGRFC